MGRRELFRIDATIEVEFKTFDQFYREYTKNISRGGLFIKTENVVKSQSVIEIVLKIPGRQAVSLVGEVVHVLEPELARAHGWEAGFGVHFVDFEEGAHQALEEYVRQKFREDPSTRSLDRRRHPRSSVRLRVKFPSLEVLQHDYSEDISHGGIFIQTQKPREVGERFIVNLIHPETGEDLELTGEVVRVTRIDPHLPGSVSGMGIRFLDVDEKIQAAIQKFLAIKLQEGDF